MSSCQHRTLEFVGKQKTDEGVNVYYKCTHCGDMLVVTPGQKVIGLKGVTQGSSPNRN